MSLICNGYGTKNYPLWGWRITALVSFVVVVVVVAAAAAVVVVVLV